MERARIRVEQPQSRLARPAATTRGPANALLGRLQAQGNQATGRAVAAIAAAFDADVSGVRINPRSVSAQRAGALAYTRGEEIHFAPGQFEPHTRRGGELLGHELMHVVQQRQGRVRPTAAGALNLDPALEREADTLGARAAAGGRVASGPASATAAGDVVQAKLGFELELLVNADIGGKKIDSGTPIGTYGTHLELTADETGQADAVTPYSQDWVEVYEAVGHPGRVASSAAIGALFPGVGQIRHYQNRQTAELVDVRPPDIRYGTILEIVTKAYSPERPAGAAQVLAAMREAVALATSIETATTGLTERVPLSAAGATTGVGAHIGNALNTGQSTDASIQSTFALALDQIGTYLKSTLIADSEGSGDRFYGLKHHSDTESTEGDRAQTELRAAAVDAAGIVDEVLEEAGLANDEQRAKYAQVRGFLTLVCQYLRMGRYFYDSDGTPLDKNITPLLSRTNLAIIRKDVLGTAKLGTAGIGDKLLAATGRSGSSSLSNLPDQSRTDGLTCRTFIANVLLRDDDGITNQLGKFKKMGPEQIRGAGDTAPTQVAPVFELRNIIDLGNIDGGRRFPKAKWLQLAEHQTYLLAAINARDNEARDAKVRWTGNWGGPTRAGRDTTETTEG
jgi:uncharacterized protein DUF4157